MSIFDKDIHLPIEHLYDACKDVASHVIPMNLMHYNAGCGAMRTDIIRELKEIGLFQPMTLNKIAEVIVEQSEYIRRIPTFKVHFIYTEEIEMFEGQPLYAKGSTLCEFTVGINGIIYESV